MVINLYKLNYLIYHLHLKNEALKLAEEKHEDSYGKAKCEDPAEKK